MRIRSMSTIYMLGTGLLATAGMLVVLVQDLDKLHQVDEARAAVRAMGTGVKFVEALALERGVYNQVLVSKDTPADVAERLVAERNQVTDALFAAATVDAAGLPAPLRDKFMAGIEDARLHVSRARGEVAPLWRDAAKTSPEAARSLVLMFVEAARAIDGSVTLVEEAASKEFRFTIMFEISRLSNDLRELAGRRSTFLSRYVGTLKPHTADERRIVAEAAGAIAATIQRLNRLGEMIDEPVLAASVRSLNAKFFKEGEPMYALVAAAAAAGTPPPMEFLPWRQWTVEMLGRTLEARDAPIALALVRFGDLRREAITRLMIASCIGLLIVLAMAGAALLLVSRVLRPVERLTAAIEKVAAAPVGDASEHGDTAVSDRYAARGDEIGSLAQALVGFNGRSAVVGHLYRNFDAILANLPQGVAFYDKDERLVASNRRYAELYELDPAAVRPGISLSDVMAMRLTNGSVDDDDGSYTAEMRQQDHGKASHKTFHLRDGRVIAVQVIPMPCAGFLSTHLDVTDRRKAEARIAHMASHDGLTGLPNRTALQHELDRLFGPAGAREVAVMCLDLDRFKAVNDALGHGHGDHLLKQVARRLTECVRGGDMVARLGGDEFAIVFPDPPPHGELEMVSRRIIARIGEVYDLDGHQALIGTSLGIAIAPADAGDGHALLKAADLALYRAKLDGRGIHRFFEPAMDAKLQERRALELDLRSALPNGEFELHYQPILDLACGEIKGFEALLRWNHPVRGRISPIDFVPLAEETGLICEIGAWVLREACLEAVSWPKPLNVAVNLSPRQFGGHTLLRDVMAALETSGLQARRLEVEITELVMLENNDATLAMLHAIRNLGVRISMDDFGTGYSSLSYLRKFPFDKIKVDQSFVRDLATDKDSATIVKAILELATGLGMITTAEGVETEEQISFLRDQGCSEAQGYLISRPVPQGGILPLLATPKGRRVA